MNVMSTQFKYDMYVTKLIFIKPFKVIAQNSIKRYGQLTKIGNLIFTERGLLKF